MAYKYFRNLNLFLVLFFMFAAVVNAEELSNSVSSIKVQSAGDKAVVVDVYISSKDVKLKPELTTRKYSNNKYVIDLMNVTNKGGVSKDTSSSAGLVNGSNVKIGNLAGGSARVVLDLNNPDVQVKDVRYHILPDKISSTQVVSVNAPSSNEVKHISKPVPVKQNHFLTPAKSLVNNLEVKHNIPSKVNIPQKSVESKYQPVIEHKSSVKTFQNSEISHKTTSPVIKTSVTAPDDHGNKKIAVTQVHIDSVIPSKTVEHKPIKPKVLNNEEKRIVLMPITEPVKNKIQPNNPVNTNVNNNEHNVPLKPSNKPTTPVNVSVKPYDIEHTPVNLNVLTENQNIRTMDPNEGGQDLGSMFLTLLGALAIVIPLIFAALWLINMFYKGGSAVGLKGLQGFSDNENFKIIASTSLGQGKSIHLVEIRGRQLVLGCTSNSINILTEFDDFDDFIEEQKDQSNILKPSSNKSKYKKGRPPVGSFAQLYKDYTSKVPDQELEDEY